MNDECTALVHDPKLQRWLSFGVPTRVVVATGANDVLSVLQRVEEMVRREQLWAVGWLSYEACTAFDPLYPTHPPGDFPLVWFALYDRPEILDTLPRERPAPAIGWRPSVSEAEYSAALAQIREFITRGDSYQVNYTFRLRGAAPTHPRQLFYRMVENQAGQYSMYIDAGRFVLCSASPELFFEREGDQIVCRPMKGTAPRGGDPRQDADNERLLVTCEKERAENIMIVDMVRNDLSRIAQKGSVVTTKVCEVERYPHLFQMTSEVRAQTNLPLSDIMTGLFPAASITGAPKGRTMEIIRALEDSPRAIYTGAMGVIAPTGRSWFNVAIRTALIDREADSTEYGVGSGVVWDSQRSNEYRECLYKAGAVTQQSAARALFETILWQPGEGYFLRERHLSRIIRSALCLAIPHSERDLCEELDRVASSLAQIDVASRVRLILSELGAVSAEVSPLNRLPSPYRVALARRPISSSDERLHHKFTDRSVYDDAESEVEGVHDVLLWNERGEITESRIANIVLDLDGELYTPPLASGLLPGCYREELLMQGVIRERVLVKTDICRARAVYLVNSLRRMWQVEVLKRSSDQPTAVAL